MACYYCKRGWYGKRTVVSGMLVWMASKRVWRASVGGMDVVLE